MAYAMLYGAAFCFVAAAVMDQPLDFDVSNRYVLSLLYLAVLGSIVTFSAYLTLLHRIGAVRAGYVGVMVPIVALVVSAAFKGLRWHALTWVGVAVSVSGNVAILREKRKETPT